MKRLVLKLGSQCNWNCKHCHNKEVNFKFNKDILEYIKNNGYERITFSGGEPCLYFNTVEKICNYLGKNYIYRMVTNGSLLDRKWVSLIGDYNINVILSFDGSDGHRSENPPINWRFFANCKHPQFSTVVYHDNMSFKKIHKELMEKCAYYRIKPKLSLQPEFIHQTSKVCDNTTFEDAQSYCKQMAEIIEPEIIALTLIEDYDKRKQRFYDCNTLRKSIGKWLFSYPKQRGIRCFNENLHNMTLDGRFILCPYNDSKVVGDIYKGIDYDIVESYLPERCLSCSIKDICRGSCVENVTENECYIARTMNRWLEKVMARYNCKDMIISLWKTL